MSRLESETFFTHKKGNNHFLICVFGKQCGRRGSGCLAICNAAWVILESAVGDSGGFIKLPLALCLGGSACCDGEPLNSAGPPPSSLLFKCRAKRPDKGLYAH